MHLLVIHNPDSGDGSWSQERVVRLLKDAGHTVHLIDRDADWRAHLHAGEDLVVAVGGDGTVHDVIFELRNRPGARMAVLPTGTANNLAHALGFTAGDDFAQRVGGWPQNEQTVQIARIHDGDVAHDFLESAGAGVFAEFVSTKGSGNRPPSRALLAARDKFLALLLDAEPVLVTLEIDGTSLVREFLLVEVLNAPLFGPRLEVAPAESVAVKLLSAWAVAPEQREAAAQWISTGAGEPDRFLLGRGARIRLAVDVPVHVDGALWPDKHSDGGIFDFEPGVAQVNVCV